MSVQPIENLQIRNFKCFKQLDVANIGRVNLIGGKNNVGKTAFLEAVELLVSSNKAYDLAYSTYKILKRRQSSGRSEPFEIDFIYDDGSEMAISSSSKSCIIERRIKPLDESDNEQDIENILPIEVFTFSVNGSSTDLSENAFLNTKFRFTPPYFAPINYIYSSKIDEQEIAILLGSLINLDREEFLNSSLQTFEENIIAIKQIVKKRGVILKLKLKNKDSLVLLSSLGEGINRYIAILCAIWASKDGILLIDEIENGIHYTNYEKLWRLIFQASQDANCQLFITSHSKECISAFNAAQFEIESCNAQYFEFYRNLKTGLITASAIDKEQLRYALTHEGRMRGE
ncbi:MAG: AAA family ATPase [Gammaproteobacteria bacterium]